VTFALSGVFLLDLSSSTRFILMWTTLGVVYSMMLVNFIVTVILTAREVKKLVQKWRDRSLLKQHVTLAL
jgi:predicted membrane protein